MLRTHMEKPSQRLHYRVTAPLRIAFDDLDYTTVNWSIGGFCVPLNDVDRTIGDKLDVRVTVPFQGFEISFEIVAEVVRLHSDEKTMAARFLDLDERSRDLLEHFVEDIVRGSMTSTEDTIRRIDTPVTPVSTKPDKNPLDAVPVRRWPIKRMAMVLFYSTVGLSLFGYIAISIYTLMTSVEIDAAVVTAPVETILASTSGIIVDVPVDQGAMVKPEQLLMRIEDANLEEAIHRAEVKILAADAEIERAQSAFNIALDRLDNQRAETLYAKRLAEIEVEDLERRIALLDQTLSRKQDLRAKGLIVQAQVDEVFLDRSVLQSKLDAARAAVSVHARKSDRSSLGLPPPDARSDETIFAADEALHQAHLARERAELQLAGLIDQRNRISVRSPEEGRLIQKLKSVGSGVKRGEPVALFERTAAMQIDAYLTHEELLRIDARRPATVYLPTEDRTLTARIRTINRESAYVDPVRSRYVWLDSDARTVRVTLEIEPGVRIDRPGAPAQVYFERFGWDRSFRFWGGSASGYTAQDQEEPIEETRS